MDYREIEVDIRPFIPIDEEEYNSLSKAMKNVVYQGARVEWLSKGAPKIDSMRYPMKEEDGSSRLSHLTNDEMCDYYYEHNVMKSTVGIENHKFVVRSSFHIPSPWEYINMVQHQFKKLKATNATLTYVGNNDLIYHLCFSKNDIEKYTVDELFDILRKGSQSWEDNSLYPGSSNIRDAISTYRLDTNHFSIMVKSTKGGYGKMIPDYYDVLGLENNEDDCLIQCFLYIYEQEYPDCHKPSIVELRKLLIKEGKLGLESVPILENLLNVKVSVVKDYRDIDIEYECPEVKSLLRPPPYTEYKAKVVRDKEVYIYGDQNCQWKLLHKDEHYDVVIKTYNAKECLCPHTGNLLQGRKPYGKKTLRKRIIEKYYIDSENLTTGGDSEDEEEKEVYYYFFDYETVFEPDTMEIIPYAYAIVKCDSKFKIMEERYKIGMDCNVDLSSYLFRETPSDNEVKYLIGYNNSRFDNFILLKYALMNNDYIGHIRFTGNTIVSGNINGFKVRDLCRILNMPLDAACKAFKIELPKLTGAIQHHEVQFFYMNHKEKFDTYLNNYHNTIRDYVVRDCVCLSQLYDVTKKTMERITHLDMSEHYTLAGMSYKAFKRVTNVSQLPIMNNSYTLYDKLIRQAIIGGRSQMQTIKEKDVCAIDCVSLYPYVMLNRRFPIGYPNQTETYVPGKIGVYNVKVIRQPHDKLNIVPLREEKLRWEYKGEMDMVLCSVDIECLKRHGAEIEVKEGIYWENDKNNLFDHYFKELIKEKKQQDIWKEEGDERYNPVIRETDKLLMNGLSGKMAQRLFDTETEIIRNANDMDRFYNKTIKGSQTFTSLGSAYIARGKKEPMPTTPCIYGVLIYAYAREHMYESVLQYLKPEELYGMDTDSAFLKTEKLDSIKQGLMGSDFGQFKVELANVDGIFIAPKCYCFYKGSEIVKARFKGVKMGKDVEIEEEIDDPIELYKCYYSNKYNKVGIETFQKLLRKEKIKIICCNIDKFVAKSNKDALYIGNHTFIKMIEVMDEELVSEIKSKNHIAIEG
ncbi:unnamed protein product [Cunninghamella echinulata]